MVKSKRSRTPSKYIYYALYLYFSGLLSLRKTSEYHLLPFVKRNHVSIWNWIQHYRPKKILQRKRRRKVQEFIIVDDETLLKVGSQYVWVWVAIEPLAKVILGIRISFERTMLIAERFLKALVIEYGKHPLSTDGGGTWYPQACRFLNIEHHIHSLYERSIIERTIQYIKDRTESFDDYFPCGKEKCMLEHVRNWFNLFVDYYNKKVIA
jgi:putative transposase